MKFSRINDQWKIEISKHEIYILTLCIIVIVFVCCTAIYYVNDIIDLRTTENCLCQQAYSR
ncbi:hypothetical protein FVB9532_02932 [Mesonia oceanica]|uniref:Uncharacterized protein n=1 Tax=Mesonia oceanica TaxID=2687242 RepID=A0AC61YAX7_9FLAO|nr:hypothetical protein FVB9532_02932 [Mesonia oceanica]